MSEATIEDVLEVKEDGVPTNSLYRARCHECGEVSHLPWQSIGLFVPYCPNCKIVWYKLNLKVTVPEPPKFVRFEVKV